MKVIQLYIIIFYLFSLSCNSQENIVEQINPNLFGFNTSNTFTYCNINDINFTKKFPKRVNGIMNQKRLKSYWIL